MSTQLIIVDDDPTNTALTKMVLELEGFNVVTTDTLAGAHAAATADIDAFVIDYHLTRGEKGIDLLRDIRAGKTDAPRDCISIISSGDNRRENDALAADATLFLCKPYTIGVLISHLQELLGDGGTDG